jgi:predicted phage terminase large subunit-like protein
MARTANGIFWVEDVKRGQWSYEERNHAIVETARQDADRYGNTVQIWGEQEGGSAGKEISEQFIKMLAGYPVYRDIVSGKGTKLLDGLELPHKPKIVRAQGLVAQAEAGNVRVKRAKWTTDFLDELVMFPESDICDQVDSAAGCLNKLCKMWTTDPGHTFRIEPQVDGERFGVHLDKSGGSGGRRRL